MLGFDEHVLEVVPPYSEVNLQLGVQELECEQLDCLCVYLLLDVLLVVYLLLLGLDDCFACCLIDPVH
jgi:hypothetical protein